MDSQLSSLLKYWYFPSRNPARENCDRITTSTALLFLTLWTISLTVHLLLGSVHARYWIRQVLSRCGAPHGPNNGDISVFPNFPNSVNKLGTSVLHVGFSLATAAVLSKGGNQEDFKNALALWLLRPTASSLINLVSLLVNKEIYSDAAAYISQGEYALSLLSIWPFAFMTSAIRNIDDSTREFLQKLNLPKSAISLLKAGCAFGILHWILFLYGIVMIDIGWCDFEVPRYPIIRPIVVVLNFVRLGASCFLWLGALHIVGNPQICVFYLDPTRVSLILVLWTLEPILEAFWSALFPSFIPFDWKHSKRGVAGVRDWKIEPIKRKGDAEMRVLSV